MWCSNGGSYHQAGAAVCLAGPSAAGIRILEEEEEELSAASPPLSHFSLYTAKFKGWRHGGDGGYGEGKEFGGGGRLMHSKQLKHIKPLNPDSGGGGGEREGGRWRGAGC